MPPNQTMDSYGAKLTSSCSISLYLVLSLYSFVRSSQNGWPFLLYYPKSTIFALSQFEPAFDLLVFKLAKFFIEQINVFQWHIWIIFRWHRSIHKHAIEDLLCFAFAPLWLFRVFALAACSFSNSSGPGRLGSKSSDASPSSRTCTYRLIAWHTSELPSTWKV
jgi:hypothetical protein